MLQLRLLETESVGQTVSLLCFRHSSCAAETPVCGGQRPRPGGSEPASGVFGQRSFPQQEQAVIQIQLGHVT